MAGLFLIHFGPEQAEQRVSTVKAARSRGGKIRKESYPLRPAEQGVQRASVSIA
jgi:hypothetical protein